MIVQWYLTLQAWTDQDGRHDYGPVSFVANVEDAQAFLQEEIERFADRLAAKGLAWDFIIPRLECHTPLFGRVEE